ncbi:hypothetical protein F5Y11DRAFT_86200 [Daldinia sp. FL1419]|nr:hypothetical protein F5Y11DRAFT_86200 [Daldinia sp. FL1419]
MAMGVDMLDVPLEDKHEYCASIFPRQEERLTAALKDIPIIDSHVKRKHEQNVGASGEETQEPHHKIPQLPLMPPSSRYSDYWPRNGQGLQFNTSVPSISVTDPGGVTTLPGLNIDTEDPTFDLSGLKQALYDHNANTRNQQGYGGYQKGRSRNRRPLLLSRKRQMPKILQQEFVSPDFNTGSVSKRGRRRFIPTLDLITEMV